MMAKRTFWKATTLSVKAGGPGNRPAVLAVLLSEGLDCSSS